MRPEESLTALLSKVRERKILVYDLESKDGDTQRPGFTRVFLAGVYDGERFQAFRNHSSLRCAKDWASRAIQDGGCIDQCMRYILAREYRGHYIYAHNGGAFDHLHILPWLTARIEEFSYVIVPIQSTIQVLKVTERSSKQTWTFLDSIRLLPMGLDKVAKTFGLGGKVQHKLETPEDAIEEWDGYLEGDCVKLHQSLVKFQTIVKDEMGGELGITTPSTAMKLYRRKYMGHGKAPAIIDQHRHFKECDGRKPLPLEEPPANVKKVSNAQGQHKKNPPLPNKNVKHGKESVCEPCNACMHDWIRKSYYGGRTEVYRSAGKGLTYYDINSSYPRAMLEDMPAGIVKQYGPKKTVADFYRIERDAIGFVECEVYIPPTCYLPPLPYRDEQRGKLIFPTGTFRGVWAWDELKLLFDRLVGGTIKTVTRSVWYQRKSLFFDFVKELYRYRDKDQPDFDEGMALIAKLMMNSLYGKFGMNEDRREIIVLGKGEKPPEGATFPRFEDGAEDVLSRVCFIEKHVSPPYIIPQISSQITALARIRLWNFMADIVRRGGSLYYCDTDSIITDLSDIPTSSGLGDLKNEYPGELIEVEISGPKMYMLRKAKAFKDEHRPSCPRFNGKASDVDCKGCSRVKLAMKGIPKDKRTEATLKKFRKGQKVEFGRLEKLGAMAERGFRTPPRMRDTHKHHIAQYDKRTFIDGGTDSFPIHLEPSL
jgi:hypothetical protein